MFFEWASNFVETAQLSEPFEVFSFELSKAPDESGHRQQSVIVINDGRAHALVSWYFPANVTSAHSFCLFYF